MITLAFESGLIRQRHHSEPTHQFLSLEFPETADLVSWHVFAVNPLVNRIPLDPEVGGDLFKR